jgi:isopentenyl-diphosphate delta-isomerase
LERDDRVVSSDDEQLILVDSNDHEIGFLAKADAHRGRGTLHRAFSLFVFNPAGELLLQQRAMSKRLWPGYWSNSCCSHPHRGETIHSAVRRRLREELGLSVTTKFLFKFEYQSQFDTYGAEHELCWVYAGCSADLPRVNSLEIAAWRYLDPESLQIEIDCTPETFTPWFRISWPRVNLQRTLPDNPGDVDPVDQARCR